jgi:hypothetical protein
MLSNRVRWRIQYNKRQRLLRWEMRKKYGINRALWPSAYDVAYNLQSVRTDGFVEMFFPLVRVMPDEVEYSLSDRLVESLGISPDLITAGPEFSTAEVMQRHYGPKEVTYTTAYHAQAERVDRNEEIAAIMRLPKAIGTYLNWRERITIEDPRHPLNFTMRGWSPEITAVLALNSSSGERELKVIPTHRHHHWPRWAYEEYRAEQES